MRRCTLTVVYVRNFNSVTEINKIKMAACRLAKATLSFKNVSQRRNLDLLTGSDHQIQTKGTSSFKA